MELTVEQALQQGIAAHKDGKLEEAERLYRAILQSHPAHPDANHNLGVLAVSVNKAEEALPLFKTALEANPKIEQFWLSYADALIKEQQYEAASQVIAEGQKQGFPGENLNALGTQLAQARTERFHLRINSMVYWSTIKPGDTLTLRNWLYQLPNNIRNISLVGRCLGLFFNKRVGNPRL